MSLSFHRQDYFTARTIVSDDEIPGYCRSGVSNWWIGLLNHMYCAFWVVPVVQSSIPVQRLDTPLRSLHSLVVVQYHIMWYSRSSPQQVIIIQKVTQTSTVEWRRDGSTTKHISKNSRNELTSSIFHEVTDRLITDVGMFTCKLSSLVFLLMCLHCCVLPSILYSTIQLKFFSYL